MASALEFGAINSIINGGGLAISSDFSSAMAKFNALPTVSYVSTMYSAMNNANTAINANIASIVNTVADSVSTARWALDFVPLNINTGTGSITLPEYWDPGNYRLGNVYSTNVANTTSLSLTITALASKPFSSGIYSFANVYTACMGHAGGALDINGSARMLENRTYADCGFGFTGPNHLATGGIGENGPALANIVSRFGTLYDVKNISKIADPYVLGQNLINQNLASYGNLIQQFTDIGLDLGDLTRPPPGTTKTLQQDAIALAQTSVGEISYPTLATTTTTTTSAGASTDVMARIYQSITGSDLSAIMAATGVNPYDTNAISNLNDFFNYEKVVGPADRNQLRNSAGVTTFSGFGEYLSKLVGKGSFSSWADMAKFFTSIVVPSYSTADLVTTKSTDPILPSSIRSNVTTAVGMGSGPVGNPVLIDYLGACAGIPYAANLNTLASSYSTISSAIEPSVLALRNAVLSYVSSFVTTTVYTSYTGATGFNGNLANGTAWSGNVLTVNATAVSSFRTDFFNVQPGGLIQIGFTYPNSVASTATLSTGNLASGSGSPYAISSIAVNVGSTAGTNITSISIGSTLYLTSPDKSAVTSAAASVVSAFNSLGNSAAVYSAETAFQYMIPRLQMEIFNLKQAGAQFGPVSTNTLKGFATGITSSMCDDKLMNSKQLFDAIISKNSAGDTLRAAQAEKLNHALLSSVGISNNNYPNPAAAIYQASRENIPISTYINRNK